LIQILRYENGNPTDSTQAGLQLKHQDFAAEALVEPHGTLSGRISIPAATLCAYIELAESDAAMIEQAKGAVTPTRPWVRKRRRQSTPAEELDHPHEESFSEEEEEEGAVEQSAKDDESYRTSSASEA
jgi:hypothetical protein